VRQGTEVVCYCKFIECGGVWVVGRLEKDEVCVPYVSSMNLDETSSICLKTQIARMKTRVS